ncbi:MAG: pantoate--beta-alanine ligase [Candidatus Omnitrophica bacterium]|nr:pantoate--beta-alanine ligase [Candidatus Omnitrophota bacterium]
MNILQSPKVFQQTMMSLRQKGKSIGFVPTLGALHEGHLSLVRKARRENDVVAVSIFVNPLQFGPKEDFKKYPRPLKRDKELLKKEKVDYIFHPSAKAMFPQGFNTAVQVGAIRKSPLQNSLCAKSRPGHFQGVATGVIKLLNLAQPENVYFGAKDFQQALMIEKMIRDVNLAIRFHRCPTVRETDGLAMSSRNSYLSADQRRRAQAISRVLFWLQDQASRPAARARKLASLKQLARRKLIPFVTHIDYLDIVDLETLEPLKKIQRMMLAVVACYVGKTRLIDNVIIHT